MALAPNGDLIVTTSYGIFLTNKQGDFVWLANPASYQVRPGSIDGEFEEASIAHSGPITEVPGLGGVYVFADMQNDNIRLLDMRARKFFTLCQSNASVSGAYLLAEDIDLVQCSLYQPTSVTFSQDGREIMIAHTNTILEAHVLCKIILNQLPMCLNIEKPQHTFHQ